MKKIYKVLIACGICILSVFLCIFLYIELDNQKKEQNKLYALEKEALPYENEINDIYSELQSRKQKLGVTDSDAGVTPAFVPTSANDIDTIKGLVSNYDFTPTIIADCSIERNELNSIIRKASDYNYDIVMSGMTFDDDVLSSALRSRNNLSGNNYDLKDTFFLRHSCDTDSARQTLINNNYKNIICYNETFSSGSSSDGLLYISYSFVRSSSAFTNLINQAISTNTDAVMIFDFADMNDGTIDSSIITGFFDEVTAKINEDSVRYYRLTDAFEALDKQESLSQIANKEYEQYRQEMEQRISELEAKIHDIYSSRNE